MDGDLTASGPHQPVDADGSVDSVGPDAAFEGGEPTVERFRSEATTWVAANKQHAPVDYGPILPPELVGPGRSWQRRLYDGGWAGVHWPTEYGGRGLTIEHQAAWLEVCALAEVPPFINMVGFVLAGQGNLMYGTADQRGEHLEPIITADRLWCQLFSEPNAGSDLASLTTSAEADGDEWVVNGHKVWTSGARYSDWGILMARTNRSAPKHKGISFFLVDMHSPGIEVRPLRQMTGDAEFDEVFFTDVSLPATALLGPENEGWNVGMAILTHERGSIGAAAISTQRRLDSLVDLAEDGLDPSQLDRLSSMLSRGKAYAFMGNRQGPHASLSSSLNKLGITELMFDTAELRADIAGAESMLRGSSVNSLLAAPGGRIAGGSSQVQRNIIGERILGLPKEPRVDKPESAPRPNRD
ncbi:MAG: acyl-CoA dehydrogenase family protein [Acidimicrobiales bacterium]